MEKTTYGTYNKFVGSKYNSNMSLDEIKENVEKDINEAIKKGELPAMKFTIKKHTFSMGRELIITVRKFLQKPINESFDKEYIENKIKEIADEYNWTEEDIMADYYSTSFYVSVRFDLNE